MQEKIKELLKDAMKSGDGAGKLTYRGLLSAFMAFLTANNRKPQDPITDDEAMAVIKKEIKKREDSIKQFTDAGRPELAQNELEEKALLMKFLPAQLSVEEVEKKVSEILSNINPLDPKMMGKYIGICVKELKDVANGDLIKTAVEKLVNN